MPLSPPDAPWAPETQAVVDAARRRGIPVTRVGDDPTLVRLGRGAAQQQMQGLLSTRTSYLAIRVAADPRLVLAMLEDARLPVPECEIAASAEHAVAIARRIRGPVIVASAHCSLVTPPLGPLQSTDEIRTAYGRVCARGGPVRVQRHVEGGEHRVLVVDGHVLTATLRHVPRVEGDGLHTVRELAAAHRDFAELDFDEPRQALLARQGLSAEAVPPPGMEVVLGTSDPAQGGQREDVTARVHPEVAETCIRAARAIGLDVCGVDLACSDIAQPLALQYGAVLGVTASPVLTPREMRAAAERMVQALFPPLTDGLAGRDAVA